LLEKSAASVWSLGGSSITQDSFALAKSLAARPTEKKIDADAVRDVREIAAGGEP